MFDIAHKTTQPAAAIPADDPSRKLSVIDPDDPALRHIAVVGDTYTIWELERRLRAALSRHPSKARMRKPRL